MTAPSPGRGRETVPDQGPVLLTLLPLELSEPDVDIHAGSQVLSFARTFCRAATSGGFPADRANQFSTSRTFTL
jgi:hypothetical protein